MKQTVKILSILFFLVAYNSISFAQKDSAKTNMSFDLGLARDWRVNFWPIIKYSKSKEEKDVQVLFPVFRYNYNYSTHLKRSHFFPIYWHDSTATNVDFRLFSLYYPSVFRYNKDFIGLSKSYRFFELAPEIDLLEFSRSPDGLYIQNNILFFLWYKNDKIHQKSHLILFPLYWNYNNKEFKTHTIPPLCTFGSYDKNKSRYLAITPFFWHFKTPTTSRNVIFPIVWTYSDSVKSNNYILPIFYDIKNPDFKSQTFIPFYSYTKYANNQDNQLVLTPFFWHTRKFDEVRNVLFPVWWQRKQLGSDSINLNVTFPLYWSYKDKNYKNTVLFPLIWSFKSKYYNTLTIPPLVSIGHSTLSNQKHLMLASIYWHFKSDNSYANYLFPIWWQKKEYSAKDTVSSNIIFPFYWSYKDRYKSYKIAFPISWSFKNSNYKSITIAPLFSKGHSIDNKSNHLVIASVYWQFKNPDKSNIILFPLWWQKKKYSKTDTACSNYIFPTIWTYNNKNTHNWFLFPLVYNFDNRYNKTFIIAPLYSSGYSKDNKNKFYMLTPLYWHIKNPDGYKNTLFPVWWNRYEIILNDTNRHNVIFPLYWSFKNKERISKVLFPFYWKVNTIFYKSVTVFPFFSRGISRDKNDKHLMIATLFWQTKTPHYTKNLLFPLWWQKTKYNNNDTTVNSWIFPLYSSFRDKKGTSNKVFIPIIWSLKNKYRSSFTIFPVFSIGKSNDLKNRNVMTGMLFWYNKNPKKTNVTLFPLFNYYKDTSNLKKFNILLFAYRYKSVKTSKSVSFIWPICEYKKNTNYKYFRFAPLVWYKKTPEINYFAFAPFYYHRKDKISNNYNILWQLYTYKNYYNLKTTKGFLWRVIYSENYLNNDFEKRFLYLVYANVKKNGNIEKSVFPFYYYSLDKYGNRSFNLMLYFYNSVKHLIPDTKEYYEEQRIFWVLRFRSNYNNLIQRGIITNKKQLK